jgi:hypothetical protein
LVPLIELCALPALALALCDPADRIAALAAIAPAALITSSSASSILSGVGLGEGILLGLNTRVADFAEEVAVEPGRKGVEALTGASTYRFPLAFAALRG